MAVINKNDPNKAAVLERVHALRATLDNEPSNPAVAQAIEQCGRLDLAISQFHAEGMRFAAYTVLRLVEAPGAPFGEVVKKATRELKAALDAAGYPH